MYSFVKNPRESPKKKKKKGKAKGAAKKPVYANLAFLVKTKNADEEGVQFEVEFEGTPTASEVRATIEDDVLTTWLDSEFLADGFRIYYKNDEGSFLMSNSTPFKTLTAAIAIVVVVNSDRMLPEQPEQPEEEPEPEPKRKQGKKKATRTSGEHELLPTGDDEEEV